jgi:hypothetical protein
MKNKVIIIPFSKEFEANEILNERSVLNEDNRLTPYTKFCKKIISLGFDIQTYDMFNLNEINQNDILISFDHKPSILSQFQRLISIEKRILIAHEPFTINNFSLNNKKIYGKILTWNEDIIDNNQIRKIPCYPITKVDIPWIDIRERKFLTNISINKKSSFPNEIYSERIKTIKIAEELFGEDFDHYGIGWNQPKSVLQKLGIKPYLHLNSYRGKVENKYDTLRNYKFSICYENTNNQKGRITEKIFDCFQSGVIPLYWGGVDVTNYIPKDTFIWREDFDSNEEMLRFIKEMSIEEIQCRIDKIKKFLNSEKMNWFWEDNYIEMISKIILDIK